MLFSRLVLALLLLAPAIALVIPSNVSAANVRRVAVYETELYLQRTECTTWAAAALDYGALGFPAPVCDPEAAVVRAFNGDCVGFMSEFEVGYHSYGMFASASVLPLRLSLATCLLDIAKIQESENSKWQMVMPSEWDRFLPQILLSGIGFLQNSFAANTTVLPSFPGNLTCGGVQWEFDFITVKLRGMGGDFSADAPDSTVAPVVANRPRAGGEQAEGTPDGRFAYFDSYPNIRTRDNTNITLRSVRGDGTMCQAAFIQSNVNIVSFELPIAKALTADEPLGVRTEFYLKVHWSFDQLALSVALGKTVTTVPAFIVPLNFTGSLALNSTAGIVRQSGVTRQAGFADAYIAYVSGCSNVDPILRNTSLPISDAYLGVSRCVNGTSAPPAPFKASPVPSAKEDDNLALMVGISVAVVVVLLCLVAVCVFSQKKSKPDGSTSRNGFRSFRKMSLR